MKPFALLMAGLKAKDPVVAGDAARLLGELGRPEAAGGLMKYVVTSRYHFKSTGMVALGQLGREMAGPERAQVAGVLGRMVENPIAHNDWYWYSYRSLRAAAALGLLMMGESAGTAYLHELADKNDDVFFCWFGPAILRLENTCDAAGEIKRRLTVETLLDKGARKTRNSEPGLMTMKAEALGLLGGEQAIAALLELARFQSRYVRGEAAASLMAASAAPEHAKAVGAMADGDAAESVRIRASLALAMKGNESRRGAVAKAAAGAKDAFERALALEGLAMLGGPEDARAVQRQTRHGDAYVRQCALESLERLDAGKARETAGDMLRDASPRVRLQAAKTLAS